MLNIPAEYIYIIVGLGGNDQIMGKGGNDLLDGGGPENGLRDGGPNFDTCVRVESVATVSLDNEQITSLCCYQYLTTLAELLGDD